MLCHSEVFYDFIMCDGTRGKFYVCGVDKLLVEKQVLQVIVLIVTYLRPKTSNFIPIFLIVVALQIRQRKPCEHAHCH